MMRSFKKKISKIKTKMGIVNVITVPVVIGAIVNPYVQPVIPRNSINRNRRIVLIVLEIPNILQALENVQRI
jgi:hypothetical protein